MKLLTVFSLLAFGMALCQENLSREGLESFWMEYQKKIQEPSQRQSLVRGNEEYAQTLLLSLAEGEAWEALWQDYRICFPDSQGTLIARWLELAFESYDRENPQNAWVLLDRILSLNTRMSGEEQTFKLLNNLGSYLEKRGEIEKAVEFYERALAIAEARKDDWRAVVSLHNLAQALETQKDLEKAQGCWEKHLLLCEKIFGRSHVRTCRAMESLGALLFSRNAWEKAERLYRRALSVREKLDGTEHPETARAVSNLGIVLFKKGEMEEARALLERAISMHEKSVPREETKIFILRSNLGGILQQVGDLDKAKVCFEKNLLYSREKFGKDHPNTTISWINLVSVMLEEERVPPETRKEAERCLGVQEAKYGKAHPELVGMLNTLGAMQKMAGDYPNARNCFSRALAIQKKSHGENHPDTALLLSNLGLLAQEMGNLGEARQLLFQALSIEQHFGEERAQTASLLHKIGMLFMEMGEEAAARPVLEKAMRIRREKLPSRHPARFESSNAIGLSLIRSNIEEAAILLETAKTGYAAMLGENHPKVAQCLENMGTMHEERGHFAKAVDTFRKACEIHEKWFGQDHPRAAQSYGHLAMALCRMGQTEEAGLLLRRCLRTFERAYGKTHPKVASVYDRLSVVSDLRGEWENALYFSRTAVQLFENALGKENPRAAQSVCNHAVFLYRVGEGETADRLLRRALPILERSYGKEDLRLALYLDQMGCHREAMGEESQAEELYRATLRMYESRRLENHPDMVFALNNLAVLAAKQKKFQEAKESLQRAISLTSSDLSPAQVSVPSTSLAVLLQNLGWVFEKMGDGENAGISYRKALSISEETFGPSHPSTISAQASLALFYRQTKEDEKAEEHIRRALENAEKGIRQVVHFPEAYQQHYLSSSLLALLEHACAILRDCSSQNRLYDLIVSSQGYTLRSARLRNQALHPRNLAELRERYREKSFLYASLCYARNTEKSDALAGLEQELQEMEYAMLERMRAAGEADFPSLHALDLQKKMGPEEILLHFFEYADSLREGSQLCVFLLDPARGARRIELGSAQRLEKEATSWNELLRSTGEIKRRHYWESASAAYLYENVWRKISSHLQGKKRIYLVPDRVTGKVSWEALPNLGDLPKHTYLVESHQFCYLNAPYELSLFSEARSGDGLLASGNITYRLSEETPGSPSSLSRDRDFAPLPYTAEEIKQVVDAYRSAHPSSPIRVLTEKEATRENLCREIVGKKYVHFATHSFVGKLFPSGKEDRRMSWNPLYKKRLLVSGIALAGASDLEPPEGIMTSHEFGMLDLRGVEILSLSACDTGFGIAIPGHGIAGLRTACICAGVKSMVLTLWPIPDRETQEFMQMFYRKLWREKKSGLDALHETKRDWIQSEKERKTWKAPVWSAFVFLGKP